MDKTQEINLVAIEDAIEDETLLYLKTLDDKTLKTLEIAKEHLGTSFSLKKSIDFLKWKGEYDKSTIQSN